ncbi:ABC transporter substrate-binding protein [Rhizocola hellebori]|uniref:ABC transporter substrate-binding protein n=1 Tax=Rhizocola hellebori TaxID=1392758 RepID=UPI0019435983|nr:ABC transporter substrate-binding protein [Rhizocola hellebori]
MALDRVDGIDRRRLLGMFAGIGAAGLTGGLSACATSTVDAPKSTVRLGLLVPATGANKAIGAELEKGFQLYLDMHGRTMSGHNIDLIVEDEGDTIQSGTAALKALQDKNVVAITGVANPDLLPSIRDAIEKSQVPMLAAHGSSADMSSAVYIWRTAFVNNEPGRAVGLYLKSRANTGKVGLIGLPDNFTKDAMSGLESEYSNVTERVWVQPTAKPEAGQFRTEVQRVLGMNPSVIFCSLPQTYLVPFLQSLRSNGGNQDVYAPGMVSENLPPDQLGAAKGLYTAMQYSSDLNNPSNRVFSAQFQTRHPNSPTAFAVAAYDAAAVLDGAIALCGNDAITALRINQEIPNVGQVVSPRGNWQFNQARSPQQKWYLRQIRPDGNIWSNVLIGDLATLG